MPDFPQMPLEDVQRNMLATMIQLIEQHGAAIRDFYRVVNALNYSDFDYLSYMTEDFEGPGDQKLENPAKSREILEALVKLIPEYDAGEVM